MIKKRPRPKIAKPVKKKNKLAQAFAATPKKKLENDGLLPYMRGDEIPMQFYSSGRPRKNQCTCESAPNKYCWVHKGYADSEANKPVGNSKVKWGDLFGGKDEPPDLFS